MMRKIIGIATAFVVFFELGAMIRHLDFHPLLQLFKTIPTSLFLICFVVGVFAGSFALGYDYILHRLLSPDVKMSWRDGLTAWAGNAVHNALDVGGIVSVKLHQLAFDKTTVSKATFRQLYWLSQSGLAIFSAIALLMHVINPGFYSQIHDTWYVIGMLLPVIGLWITKRRYQLKKMLPTIRMRQIIGVSGLDWLAKVGTFLLIGILFGFPIDYWQVIPLLIAAHVIGLVTLIPGAWGSFDLVMIIGLIGMGLDSEAAFLWLLIYRLSDTVTPLLLGLFIYLWRALTDINQEFRGVPQDLTISVMHKIVTGLLYFGGITLILTGTLPGTLTQIHWLAHFNPWASNLLLQLPNIFIGVLLVMAGRGIASRVRRAMLPTMALQMIGIGYVLYFHQNWQPLVLFGMIFLLTWGIKSALYRQQFIYSWEAQIFDGFIYGGIFVTYLILGILNMPRFAGPHHRPTQALALLIPSIHWWFTGVIALAVIILAVVALRKYFAGHIERLGDTVDEARLATILAKGDNHYANLVFLGDKRVFYYQDTVAIQFRLINNKAVMMSDPFGVASDFKSALNAFIHEADRLGYIPVFYEVSESVAMLAHEFGYNFLKLGEEAWVDTLTFKTAGKKFANIRSEINQATAAGFEFAVIQPPYTDKFLRTLRAVSDEWLAGREEKGFSLGFFDASYLQRYPIGILKRADGEIVAFATLITSQTENQMTVDLMRFSKAAPNGTMDVLFVKAFEYAREQGVTTFNLGMSPLANVGINSQGFIRERLANLVYQFGSRIYSFEGLHHYKNKFASSWHPYYIAYSSRSNLVIVMLALSAIDNPGID
ncbi:bifunctional lysylphosphatidylglycerol flippase/synthetase MprF [Weissella diestrammenae]|uniref:Bifunctional lysylphosphatidylglycerol flippase/synthetase MprF n=2 Tax=Weissella diestrammenae TaxID=1162633 RepID=A0A7G9T7J6_9LACO|nr:bifunctional lysylphosphatidylglycerol flippase/synthetase MprF [Weissella diestrammenae]QNN76071.1 bifunctional lysylphosphatidylglycerol flippase/synthetase MprF [Weissella diestrammenae]